MKTVKQFFRIQNLHRLIKCEQTGSSKDLAHKLHISERQLFNILKELRIMGVPIIYSRKLKSYKYQSECELEIHISIKILTDKEVIDIFGGSINSFEIFQYTAM